MANRQFIDDLINEALSLSRSERNDEGYQLTGKLYYAFKKSVDDNTASDLLYTTAGVFLKASNEHQVSESVYDFLASAFGVNLSYDQFLDSMNRHLTEYKYDLFRNAIDRFSDEEYHALCLFGCLIYVCDGYVTSAERELLYSF